MCNLYGNGAVNFLNLSLPVFTIESIYLRILLLRQCLPLIVVAEGRLLLNIWWFVLFLSLCIIKPLYARYRYLKLIRTHLKYRFFYAASFCNIIFSTYGWMSCLISYGWTQSSCENIQNKKNLVHSRIWANNLDILSHTRYRLFPFYLILFHSSSQ